MRVMYHGPNTIASAEQAVGMLRLGAVTSGAVTIDVETVGLKDRTPIGMAFATSPTESYYFPMDSDLLPWGILEAPLITKVFHNCMFDIPVIMGYRGGRESVPPQKVSPPFSSAIPSPLADTLLMCHHLNLPGGLADVTQQLFNRWDVVPARTFLLDHKAKTMLDCPEDEIALKCCVDAEATYELWEELHPKADYKPYHLDIALIPILVEMQSRGLVVDQEVRGRIESELGVEVDRYAGACNAMGFNPASTKQVALHLVQRGNYLQFTKKGNYMTGEEVLSQLEDPVAKLILQYRASKKLLSTYVLPFKGLDRAYTHFFIDTITGRLSSSNRNMQNWPPSMRGIMRGPFTALDFNQIELRILAYVSQDKEMMAVFADPDGDIHAATMEALGIDIRRIAKNCNFGMVYGGSPDTIAAMAEVPVPQAAEFRAAWFDKYKGAAQWLMDTQATSRRTRTTHTPMGREIYIKEMEYRNKNEGDKRAVNYPIQGGAAEIVKVAMAECTLLPMVLQIHDELVFEGDVSGVLDRLGLDSIAYCPTPYKIKVTGYWE